jgi:hypothetical protein
VIAGAIGGLIAGFASRPPCEIVLRTGGCPNLEVGFVELLAISEGWTAILGGRSGEKQLEDHNHVYLEAENLFWAHASRATQAW